MENNVISLRAKYATMRLKRLHKELLVIDETLRRADLDPSQREFLKRSKRSKVQAASRWAGIISEEEAKGAKV
jgi:type II secretory pathway component HofQ